MTREEFDNGEASGEDDNNGGGKDIKRRKVDGSNDSRICVPVLPAEPEQIPGLAQLRLVGVEDCPPRQVRGFLVLRPEAILVPTPNDCGDITGGMYIVNTTSPNLDATDAAMNSRV